MTAIDTSGENARTGRSTSLFTADKKTAARNAAERRWPSWRWCGC
jgi:hypothetical protein